MGGGEFEDRQETLKGIAALLLGLAVLAGLLCVVPLTLRARLLSILRPGEAAARVFAVEQAGGVLALPAVPDADGNSRADALHLARCFRVLACFFCGLHGSVGRRRFRHRPNEHLARRAPVIVARGHFTQTRRAIAFRHVPCIDTS